MSGISQEDVGKESLFLKNGKSNKFFKFQNNLLIMILSVEMFTGRKDVG